MESTFEMLKKANDLVRNAKKKSKSVKSTTEASKRYYYKHREEILKKRKENGDRKAYMLAYSREMRAYKKANGIPLMTEEQKKAFNERRRKRYAEDKEYRDKIKRQVNEYRERKKNRQSRAV